MERINSRLPTAGITDIPGAIRDIAKSPNPYGAVIQGVGETVAAPFQVGDQYTRLRERGQSPLYSAAGSIPFVGPAADVVTQDILQGRVPELVGDAISAAPMALGSKTVRQSPVMNAPIGEAAKTVGRGVVNVATHPATVGVGTLAATGSITTAAEATLAAAAIRTLKDPSTINALAVAPGKVGVVGRMLQKLTKATPEEQVKMIRGLPEEEFRILEDHLEAIKHNDAIDAAVQAQRDSAAMDQLRLDRARVAAEDAQKAAVEKARTAETTASAKSEVKLIDLDEKTTARNIAAAEKAAAKAEAAGQKFDQGLFKRQAAELAKQGKEALSDRARAWKESQGSASFEVKILESSDRAIAKTQAETAALAKKMETQAGAELAASVKKMDELHRRAYVEDGVRRRALERIEKKVRDKEAAKAPKSSPAPASAAQTPATAAPATPALSGGAQSVKVTDTPGLDLTKARKSATQMVYSTDKSGKAYSVESIADGLRKTYKDLSPESAAQIAKEVKAKAVHPETVAGGLASKDIGIAQIAEHLHDTYGIPTSKAVEAAFKEVQARGTAMTPAQRAEYLALKGKNLKKIGLDLKPRS